ncbi:MAG: hypothetical protein NVS3B5_01910 [Sphingomicrobium sp.]
MIGIEFFGPAADAAGLRCLDDRPKALKLAVGVRQLAGLFEEDRAQRLNVIRTIRFHGARQH